MSFRTWRERQKLAQEKVAEISGLSLRTVQRLEAGHRVSYASLRALAVAFKADVDALERELYAGHSTTEDYVEVPRWARRLNDRFWFPGLRASRRDIYVLEGLLVGCGLIFLVASFFVSTAGVAKAFRLGAALELACGYYVSVCSRVIDAYGLWPQTGVNAGTLPQPARTWRRRTAEYGYLFGIGLVTIVIACWLIV
jgi:transcriptional regulator with XRE-family HTH domain